MYQHFILTIREFMARFSKRGIIICYIFPQNFPLTIYECIMFDAQNFTSNLVYIFSSLLMFSDVIVEHQLDVFHIENVRNLNLKHSAQLSV